MTHNTHTTEKNGIYDRRKLNSSYRSSAGLPGSGQCEQDEMDCGRAWYALVLP